MASGRTSKFQAGVMKSNMTILMTYGTSLSSTPTQLLIPTLQTQSQPSSGGCQEALLPSMVASSVSGQLKRRSISGHAPWISQVPKMLNAMKQTSPSLPKRPPLLTAAPSSPQASLPSPPSPPSSEDRRFAEMQDKEETSTSLLH